MPARGFPIVAILFAAALLASSGCGGGSDSGGVMGPAFLCSGPASAGVNTVAMSCGSTTGVAGAQVRIVIGGPMTGTTSVDGVNFDITYDPAKLYFVSWSANAGPPFSSALPIVELADDQQGRVVASIQQQGGVDAVVSPGEHTILVLSFRAVAGVTFGPTALTFDHEEATNASTGISFVDGLTLEYQ